MRNILLPWRSKRTVTTTAPCAEFTAVNAINASQDARQVELREELAELRQELSELRQELSELRPQLSELRPELPELRQAFHELREDSYTIREIISKKFDDASWRRLKSAGWDIQRGLAAVKNEVAAEVGVSLRDFANQTADQRFWLEQINVELAGLRAQLGELYRLVRGTSLTAHSDGKQDATVDQSTIAEGQAPNGKLDVKSRRSGTR